MAQIDGVARAGTARIASSYLLTTRLLDPARTIGDMSILGTLRALQQGDESCCNLAHGFIMRDAVDMRAIKMGHF